MHKKALYIITALLLLLPATGLCQNPITEFIDTFERTSLDTTWNDETHTLWDTNHPQTYDLSISDNIFNVDYNRGNHSAEDASFRFTPPEDLDLLENPRISIYLKSDVSTTLTIRTIYSPFTNESKELDIPGDDTWRTYSIPLDEDNVANNEAERFHLYLDYGSTASASGQIEIDNIRFGGRHLYATDIQTELTSPTSINLSWGASDADAVDYFNIYRSTQAGSSYEVENLQTTTSELNYEDEELDEWATYYYSVIPVDTNGFEYPANSEIRQPTYDPSTEPEITITSINTDEPGIYEKFELEYDLDYISSDNPYDPDQLDVYALLESPDGEEVRINGFYDNYNDADQWKLRFAPDQTGEWNYQLFVENTGRTAQTELHQFEAIESIHQGPLTVSHNNPDYLMHHDGSSFYGLAIYYPWNIREGGGFTGGGLEELHDAGVNLFGYWNSTYDEGGGSYLLESMDSGLGRYDQRKAGRIDQILEWSEDRDMNMMFAIWAHDWLRIRGEPWNVDHSEWHNNPYSKEFDPVEFYKNERSREYQKNQYRYIIARWGHSRAMGIWELINEIHGTTGFDRDPQAGIDWTNWMHDYFKENDYFNRPTTASYGDRDIWRAGQVSPDMPNFHYYEGQGYPQPYSDPVRDGLHNITEVYSDLKQAEGRPAILGEAGYYTMFSDADSPEYTEEFHNAFWSGVASGMATTPFWWEFNQSVIMTDERMEVYGRIKDFTENINFAHTSFEPAEVTYEGTKIFALYADTTALGWLWNEHSGISDHQLRLSGLENNTYEVEWYDTRAGETVGSETMVSAEGSLPGRIPDFDEKHRDVAFKINRVENGTDGVALDVFLKELNIDFKNDDSPEEYTFVVYIKDGQQRLVPSDDYEITLTLSGPGELENETVSTTEGSAAITYIPDEDEGGDISLTAESENLESANWSGQVIASSGQQYHTDVPSDYQLEQNYPNPFNPVTTVDYTLPESSRVSLKVYDVMGREVKTLVDENQSAGSYSVSFNGSDLSSGTYIYRLEAGEFSKTRRMMLIK